MTPDFDQYAQKGRQFIHELAKELGNEENPERAGRILRAVFHTLRIHLPLQESFQLLAQLPMALKGVYVDGWQPMKDKSENKKKYGFVQEVMTACGPYAETDFLDIEDGVTAVKAVFAVLHDHITQGEYDDLKAVLPKELKQLLEEAEPKMVLRVKRG